jgi:hypothetical protein
MGIFDTIKQKKIAKVNADKAAKSKLTNLPEDLKAEILAFREKKKHFEAGNETETYVVLQFSCNKDKDTFMQSIGMPLTETFLDGYEFSTKKLGKPFTPTVKLPRPLDTARFEAVEGDLPE